MWQELYAELKDRDFTVLAVAFDSREGASRPWIDEARPGYVTLIDPYHHVADLYNMPNVNQAVWIDEDGRIVRPTESAGAYEGFRSMNRETAEMPADVARITADAKSTYHNALRDWVRQGAASRFAFDPGEARAHLVLPTGGISQAHAVFALAQYLNRTGRSEEGERLQQEASRLHPSSWNIWRQGAGLTPNGLAAQADFWERVDALGDKRYYAPVDMEGMPR